MGTPSATQFLRPKNGVVFFDPSRYVRHSNVPRSCPAWSRSPFAPTPTFSRQQLTSETHLSLRFDSGHTESLGHQSGGSSFQRFP